jgi:hypothetical protein
MAQYTRVSAIKILSVTHKLTLHVSALHGDSVASILNSLKDIPEDAVFCDVVFCEYDEIGGDIIDLIFRSDTKCPPEPAE